MDAPDESVILLHGLARGPRSMLPLQHALEGQGYRVENVGYASRHAPVETLAEQAIAPALNKCSQARRVHFVTHSLGGILVRQYLRQHSVENLGRVVMLGPPNRGSEVVDRLGTWPGFHFINGDAGMQLGVAADSLPNQLGAAAFELGVIAGNRSINPLLSLVIPGDNDGKVSVSNTRLEGMQDHLVMPVTHPLMMRDKRVIAQVIHFLKTGAFRHDD